jgi:RNA polymerase sigma factor (TIGR02999 family)
MSQSEDTSEVTEHVSVRDFSQTLYDELRKIAAVKMRGERGNHTLGPTALVHEAWVRMQSQANLQDCQRGSFLAAAAQTMRRVLIDWARRRNALAHSPEEPVQSLDGILADPVLDALTPELILMLDEALNALAEENDRCCSALEMRIFSGMSTEEISEQLQISTASVKRDLQFARAFVTRFVPNP